MSTRTRASLRRAAAAAVPTAAADGPEEALSVGTAVTAYRSVYEQLTTECRAF